jgi:ribulose-5-phosphate 4-epimerase/fuculose-1-phosphate aldolase
VHPTVDLVTDAEAGDAVATTLGDDTAVVLRANGALAVGADLTDAAVALWFLEERARVALEAAPLGHDPGPIDDATRRTRMRHTPAEAARAARWFTTTFGDDIP